MSSGSYYTLNSKYNQLLALIQKYIATSGTQDLASVLGVGNSAGASDINLNNNDITNVSLINGSPYPPVAPATPALSAVLTAGDNAGGLDITNLDNLGVSTITATNSGVGYTTNPQLILANSNATAGNTTGVPSIELTKTGRNGATGDVVGSVFFNALDGVGVERTFGKIESTITTNIAPSNYDGALDFYSLINGTNNLVFRMNGADNENNTFRPLDLNGNALKTSQLNMDITTIGSTGTGNLTIHSKAALTETALGVDITSTGTAGDAITLTSFGNINLIPASGGGASTASIRTDSDIQTKTSTGGNKINFQGGNADERFNIDKTELLLHWNNAISDQSTITIENDIASLNSAISQFYQSASGNVQTLLQNTPSVQRFQQTDSINGRTSEIRTDKIELGNSASTTALINNNLGSDQNELLLSATNSFSSLSTQARVLNTPTGQAFILANSAGTSNTKTLTLLNEPAGAGSLTYSNAIDGNPFNITTNQDLNISSTKAGGSTQLYSPNGVEIRGDNSVVLNANNNTGGSITLSCNATGSLNLNGTALQTSSGGSSSGQYLVIVLNGTTYKIDLLS
jgi:hypothetical protein